MRNVFWRLGSLPRLRGRRMGRGAGAEFDLLVKNGRVVDGTGNPSYVGDVGIRQGRVVAVGNLQGRTAARVIDAKRAGGGARVRRHAQPFGQQHPRRRRRLQHDLPGRDLGDPGRGRTRPRPARLSRPSASTGPSCWPAAPRSTSALTSARRRSGPRSGAARAASPARPSSTACGPRPAGDGRRRPGGGQLPVGTARLLDRHRHAGGDVRGGGACRRHLLDPHAARGARRVQGGGRGDGDRPPGQGPGRHHPHQDLREHPVGPDAEADREGRRGPGRPAPWSRRTSTPTPPGRTTSAPSCRPGRTRAARRRWWPG